VLTDAVRHPAAARRFALHAVAGSLALFGLFRLSWVEAQVLLPVTRVQGRWAEALFGAPAAPVQVTLACSGADVLALCLAAVVAYPVAWRARFAGAAGGAALVLGLNTLRIGTLGQAVASPAWFTMLHLYVWPAVLTLAVAGYVFTWMRVTDGAPLASRLTALPQPSRRFVVLAGAFLLLFLASSPLYLESAGMLALGGVIAHAAAWTLGILGTGAYAEANVLGTPSGAFLVTGACIATPLIPVYLAAVCAYATTGRRLAAGLLAALPLFVGLGIARLLVVALPEALVTAPLVLVHAFHQLLLGAVVVCVAAVWRHGGRAAAGYAVAGIAVGVVFVALFGAAYTGTLTTLAGTLPQDEQGAIALLPSFQVGLFLALWVAAFAAVDWRYLLAGLAMLGLSQAAGLVALSALASQADVTASVLGVRGWAVAGPVLLCAAAVHLARARR
jgi:exosortase/archaeosortase family protein